MSEKISEKVFEKINNDKVKMRSCGYFRTKSGAWLVAAGMLFMLTAVMVSLGMYYIESYKPAFMLVYKPVLFIFTLPYLFIAASILLMFSSAKCYRKSRNMCRHEEWMLFTVLLLGSFVVGYSIYSTHLDWKLRLKLEKSGVYQKMVMTPKYFWTSPDKGTLSGVVIRKMDADVIVVKNWDGTKWNVLVLDKKDIHPEKTEPRSVVKMVGEKGENRHFVAQKIWQWH